jgi:hypothetical protein
MTDGQTWAAVAAAVSFTVVTMHLSDPPGSRLRQT